MQLSVIGTIVRQSAQRRTSPLFDMCTWSGQQQIRFATWLACFIKTLKKAAPTALIYLQLAVMMITAELAHRLGKPPPAVHCLDPGTVNSKLLDKGWGMIGMDVKVHCPTGLQDYVFVGTSAF